MFVSFAETVQVMEGKSVELPCRFNKSHAPAAWYTLRNGNLTEVDSTGNIDVSGNNMTISNVTIEDERQYVALQYADAGYLIDKCIVHLVVNGKVAC